MNDKNLWVGYLTLALKKTLVASDDRVETGNKKTIFLYNQERNEIVEYSRENIQSKLSDAPAADYNVAELAAAYQNALRKAKPNLYRVIFTPNAGGSAIRKEKKAAVTARDDDTLGDEIEPDDNIDMDEGSDSGGDDDVDK